MRNGSHLDVGEQKLPQPLAGWAYHALLQNMQKVLGGYALYMHAGFVGDGGRLDKAEQERMKRFTPTLTTFADPSKQEETVATVRAIVQRLRQAEILAA